MLENTIVNTIKLPKLNLGSWRDFNVLMLKNTQAILDDILYDLDCTKEIDGYRVLMTTYPRYKDLVYKYYYFLLRLNNYIVYNKYIEKLEVRHKNNIDFENNNKPIVVEKVKHKVKPKTKRLVNKYYRVVTKDLYNNKEIYIYQNDKTGDVIESDNPNLLETLNAKVKKPKRNKVVSVPLNTMTFSFKKK